MVSGAINPTNNPINPLKIRSIVILGEKAVIITTIHSIPEE